MTHSIHKEGDILQIYFGVIFRETRHHTQAHVTSGTLIHCPFFGHKKNTDSRTTGLMISLASVCYVDSQFAKHFFHLHLVFQPVWGWDDLGSLQLPHSNFSPEGASDLSGYIFFPAIGNKYNGLPYLVSSM
jgi:hypothetical protein